MLIKLCRLQSFFAAILCLPDLAGLTVIKVDSVVCGSNIVNLETFSNNNIAMNGGELSCPVLKWDDKLMMYLRTSLFANSNVSKTISF